MEAYLAVMQKVVDLEVEKSVLEDTWDCLVLLCLRWRQGWPPHRKVIRLVH